MGRLVGFIAIFLAGAAFGYFYVGQVSSRQKIPISRYETTSNQLGCKAKASASIFVKLDGKSIEAESGPGTDSVALRINSGAKQISLLTAAAVKNGVIDGDKFVIVHEDSRRTSAVHVDGNGGIGAIIVIKSEGIAIWTKASDGFLTNAQAFMLECS